MSPLEQRKKIFLKYHNFFGHKCHALKFSFFIQPMTLNSSTLIHLHHPFILTLSHNHHRFKALWLTNARGCLWIKPYDVTCLFICNHWGETLISLSLWHEFKEITTWHSFGNKNPNSWLCYYGTLWLPLELWFDHLNPNYGPMC